MDIQTLTRIATYLASQMNTSRSSSKTVAGMAFARWNYGVPLLAVTLDVDPGHLEQVLDEVNDWTNKTSVEPAEVLSALVVLQAGLWTPPEDWDEEEAPKQTAVENEAPEDEAPEVQPTEEPLPRSTSGDLLDRERQPISLRDRVKVVAYSLGARQADVGRMGTVVSINKTRIAVDLEAGNDHPAEVRSMSPRCVRIVKS